MAINDMLTCDPTTTIPLFHQLSTNESLEDPYGPIVKCLSMDEEFAILGSLRILGVLIAYVRSYLPHHMYLADHYAGPIPDHSPHPSFHPSYYPFQTSSTELANHYGKSLHRLLVRSWDVNNSGTQYGLRNNVYLD